MKKKTKITLGVIGTICVIGALGNNGENETAPERTIPTETTSVTEYYESETTTDTITELIETTLSTQTPQPNTTTAPKNETQEIATTMTTVTSKQTTTLPSTTVTTVTSKQTTTLPSTTKPVVTEIIRVPEPQPTEEKVSVTVYYTKSGSKYHYENPCGNGKYYPCSLEEALRSGLQACEKCVYH